MTKTILNWIRHVYWEASFTLFYLPSVVSADSQSLDDWPINQSDKLVWVTCVRLHPDKISHSLEGVEKLKARWWLVVQQVLVIHKPIRRIRNIGQLMIWHVYIKHLQGEHTAVSNNNILTGTVNQWLPGKKVTVWPNLSQSNQSNSCLNMKFPKLVLMDGGESPGKLDGN